MGPAQSGSLSTAQARAERRKLPQRNSASILSIVEHCAPQDSRVLRSWLRRAGLWAHTILVFYHISFLSQDCCESKPRKDTRTLSGCQTDHPDLYSDFIRFHLIFILSPAMSKRCPKPRNEQCKEVQRLASAIRCSTSLTQFVPPVRGWRQVLCLRMAAPRMKPRTGTRKSVIPRNTSIGSCT